MSNPSAAVAAALERWRGNLIDLTRRNPLIALRSAGSSMLELSHPAPAAIWERLVREGKTCSFWLPPLEENGTDKRDDAVAVDLEHIQTKPGEIVCGDLGRQTLLRTLTNLYRRTRLEYQERGLHILHVAYGVLGWRDPESGETFRSPLLLVPAELERAALRDPFKLTRLDEDPLVNPALTARLKQDFGFELPGAPEVWEETDLAAYLGQVETAVAGLPGWKVEAACRLSLFSFFKGVMYRDLEENAPVAAEHPLVRALCGEGTAGELTPTPLPDEAELDAVQPPDKSFTILDADASQRMCLEAVKRGHSFVLHGPPGTGKSQTIANLIAQCLADGKKVLFVSEKIAALEVVFNRLRAAGLGDYCLELHSHKANKRSVVQELKRCLETPARTNGKCAPEEFEKLQQRREHLTRYVQALHQPREPLQRSVWWMQGELVRCAALPTLNVRLAEGVELSPHWLDDARQAVQRAQQLWHIPEQGENYPWWGFKVGERYTLQLREEVVSLLEKARKQLDRLMQAADQYGAKIGANGSVPWLLRAGELLETNPRPPASWLTDSNLSQLAKDLDSCAESCRLRGQSREPLTQRYGSSVWSVPAGTAATLEKAWHEAMPLLAPGDEKGAGLLTRQQQLRGWAADTQKRIPTWLAEAKTIEKWLNVTVPQGEGAATVVGNNKSDDPSPHWLRRLLRLAHLCASDNAPERAWVIEPRACEAVKLMISANKPTLAKYLQTRAKLLATYTEPFFELELERIAEGFAGSYRSWLRFLNMEFRRDRRAIVRRTKAYQMPASIGEDIVLARDLMHEKARLEAEQPGRQAVLGRYEKGLETNYEAAERAVRTGEEAVQLVIELGHDELPQKFIEALSSTTPPPEKVRAAIKRLMESMGSWTHGTDELKSYLPIDSLPGVGSPLEECALSAVLCYSKELQASLNHFATLADPVLTKAAAPPPDAATLADDLGQVEKLRKLEENQVCEDAKWSARFGPAFQGMATDWDGLRKRLSWTIKVREHFKSGVGGPNNGGIPPEAFVRLATTDGAESAPTKDLRHAQEQFQHALHSFENRFETPGPKVAGTGLASLPLDQLKARLGELRERAGELSDWTDWHYLGKRFEHLGLAEFWKELVKARPPREHLVDMLLKSILTGMLDGVLREEPALRDFRCEEHERILDEFRELDRKLLRLNAERVAIAADKRRPDPRQTTPGAEAALLMREAHKKTRHLPVRRLFEEIPDLLLRLKPCMLMSPLSVCQFLDPSKVRFDVVVFDEASQIRPEDAVGAILRGKQVVVTGDDKQLPPTDFFQQLVDDDGEEESVEAPASFESVLDACLGAGLSPHFLRWHYRSRREGLIAYSNRQFYDGRLITFPGPFAGASGVGVYFCHVTDSVYDRGGRRDNVREAEVVADMVLDHFRTHGDSRTLGVIAFSQAQMFAIEDELERRLAQAPEMEAFFKSDRLGGFFVKNLETVQGDERDVIILSVGYGRDAQGKFTMHFGPVNREGGERRLNVAVTRAREQLIVVSSIRAADLDVSATKAQGIHHLQRYLDFAERGMAALETSAATSVTEPSALEADLITELRKLGYEALPRIGCGEYRVDVGVIDPRQPARFLLGIECDGADYHETPTARDRDRLRQEVLERLGWRVHRIWSTEWFNRRHQELARLREALERANGAPLPAEISPPVARPKAPESSAPTRTKEPATAKPACQTAPSAV